jgi:bacillithiol system protein YtxJ
MKIIAIESECQLQELIRESHIKPLWIFKHSTRCPASAGALIEFEAYARELPDTAATLAMIKVIEQRPLSDALARLTGVQHASPQAILVKEGKAVWHESHWQIDQKAFRQALSAHS